MTWPKHKNPSSEDRRAHAPYNFVPLPEKVIAVDDVPPQDRYHADRHTGYVDCVLTSESPLYVRGGLTPAQFEEGAASKDIPDFFYIDPDTKTPVIPGSTLRGMLRTLVEIVGYGKVQPVSRERLIYRAVGDTTSFGIRYRERLMREDSERHFTPLMRAGYIERRGYDWYIKPAQSIGGTTFARIWGESVPSDLPNWHGCKNARRIWVRVGTFGYKDVRGGFIKIKYSNVERSSPTPEEGLVEGVWVRSGRMFSKKFDMVVFPVDDGAEPIPVPDELVMTYREQLSKEQVALLGEDGVLRDKQPIFYLVENGALVFFGHTMMMRLPYRKTPQDFVPPALRDPDTTDLAEAMFGYIERDTSGQKGKSRAGRIFVSDAHMQDGQPPDRIRLTGDRKGTITPRILSSPKPTTFQHYLTQQTPDAQPAGRTKDGKPKYKVTLSHYASLAPSEDKPGEAVIRGHKLYWHKSDVSREQIEEPDEVGPDDTQHTRIKPISSGVEFRFRVWFESLSQIELGVLLWVLSISESGKYCHKLGMGKPLGMGAISIKSELHLTDRRARYQALFGGDTWELGEGGPNARVEDEKQKALRAFEEAILGDDDLNPRKVRSLADLPRIQALLALLSWPGPDPVKTDYIADLKEFTKRKVLPTPKAVLGEATALPSPIQSGLPAEPSKPDAVPIPESREGQPIEGQPSLSPGKHTGTVVYFNLKDGLGRVLPDGSDTELEIGGMNQLRSGIGYLTKDQRVSFTVVLDDKGTHLENVEPVES